MPEAINKSWQRMPSDTQAMNLMHKRAVRLACDKSREVNAAPGIPYLLVQLGPRERYGIPYQYLDEVMYSRGLTRVPCTPSFIAGVIGRRGSLITVLDLGEIFKVSQRKTDEHARVVVIKYPEMMLGLLVGEVVGNDRYDPASLAPALPSDGVMDLAYVLGIHESGVTILNIQAMLEGNNLKVEAT
jgi:purine-binding chemotaxis protein CheW